MKHMKTYPNRIDIMEKFDYKDGYLIRKKTTVHNARKGDRVGCKNTKGYIECKIGKQKYSVHRLIWIWHYGDIPPLMVVNHKNEIKTDNRIENLELVTNRKNTALSRKNKTGFVGVTKNGNNGWSAYINPVGSTKCEYLGMFRSPEEAARAYDKKARELEGKTAYVNFPVDESESFL